MHMFNAEVRNFQRRQENRSVALVHYSGNNMGMETSGVVCNRKLSAIYFFRTVSFSRTRDYFAAVVVSLLCFDCYGERGIVQEKCEI